VFAGITDDLELKSPSARLRYLASDCSTRWTYLIRYTSNIWGLDLHLRDNNGQNSCLVDVDNFGDNVVNDLPIPPELIPSTYVILRSCCPLVEVQFVKWPRAFPRQLTGENLTLESTDEEAGVSLQIASVSLIRSPSL